MFRKVAWIAAGVAGLLAAGGVAAATAANATVAAPPVAVPHWHVVKTVQPAKTDFGATFTAVVATGKTTAWAFDGQGLTSPPTAWRLIGKAWTKVAFPGKKNEEVITAGASSPSDVWAFTDISGAGSRVLRWNGAKWSVVRTFTRQIGGASVVAGNDVWVFGEPITPGSGLGAWHYDGHAWKQVGKNLMGGSALSATDAWAFNGTNVDHWNGRKWASTSVKSLLPPVIPGPLNDPSVVDVLALSDGNVYAVGNGNDEDDGGPVVVLHYNGHKWAKVAQGLFGFGPGPQISYDGSGGLWLPISPNAGGLSYLAHYAAGKLTKATLPVSAPSITIAAVARIPGTTQQLAGGFTHGSGNLGANVVAVILQYS
jgi:hypothetical protein